ncbi:MAG: hypothetical protein U0X58_01085 [Flavobacteriaceae bacterium]
MKKLMLFLLAFAVLACKSGQDKSIVRGYKKLDTEDLNPEQKNKTAVLGKQILSTCNTSHLKPLSPKDATDKVIKNMTVKRMTQTCLKFRTKYGNFKELTFVEAYKNRKTDEVIYRYQAKFDKKNALKELRMLVNEQNQLAAVQSKDWNDVFVP